MANIILFGASGDISKKKIYPALYEWYKEDSKAINQVIGYGISKLSNNDFHKLINNNDEEFLKLFSYQHGQYTSFSDIKNLKTKLSNKSLDLILYFGIPSYVAPPPIEHIVNNGFEKKYKCRYILEKPIGDNYQDCINILNKISSFTDSKNVYILDHYLGKNNIRGFINNSTNNYISNINIKLNEKELVDHRLEYFDNVGIFKDMVQSHALSILFKCFPNIFNNTHIESLINNKNIYNTIKVLECRKSQYDGYKGKDTTETYIYLKLECDSVVVTIES
jgi:glucose-6-phosphate 1-dehydrogenase